MDNHLKGSTVGRQQPSKQTTAADSRQPTNNRVARDVAAAATRPAKDQYMMFNPNDPPKVDWPSMLNLNKLTDQPTTVGGHTTTHVTDTNNNQTVSTVETRNIQQATDSSSTGSSSSTQPNPPSNICLECGQFTHVFTDRIVGGINANLGEFPWQVSMQRQPGSRKHFCGGSIISEHWILTAAHCVESMKYTYTPGSIRIVLGTVDWRNTQSGSPQMIAISRIVVHDGWNRNTGQNDIALLQTAEPIQFSKSTDGTIMANKVCLSNNANTEYTGMATSSGWGYLNKNSRVSPDLMRKVDIPIVDHNTCRNAFNRVIAVTQNQVCAGQAPKGNCMGDSGGPLVQTTGNKATQIGIVSFSIPCAVHGYPDVFTKVSRYLDWINQHTGGVAREG
ncbi:chymotrypsin-like protease CTRL-1 [Oppia nitens]|uniref:chymotrypsin-like protease CTRL-1 n=1 Tax=Oppia nitens TaxID=1686743 RepID=UPI0023DCD78E|nr:chymotrypsin-like protease CTRL-1 [Oppia nitens]